MSLQNRSRTPILFLFLIAGLIVSSCNFPGMGPTPDLFATSAAQTVAARLTQAQGPGPGPGPGPVETTEPPPPEIPATQTSTEEPATPTQTLTPTITQTTIPCDRASFVMDVTIPDGEELSPNENFTKTWRLKNNGSCTWTSSYALIFDSGDSMNGPASKQLTSGTVAPGANIDISVDLKAPSAPGTYKGFWKLRNGSGVNFGIGAGGNSPFWVEIEVVPNTTTKTIPFVSAESGAVTSAGNQYATKYLGDNVLNHSAQTFLSFDITGIDADAVITDVTIDLGDYTDYGTPFDDLGALFIYKDDYGTLNPGDFVGSTPSTGRLHAWFSTSGLESAVSDNDFINALQSKVGSSRFKLRLQFNDTTDGNGDGDYLEIGIPIVKVTYYVP